MRIVVMGVSGCGKSTVARALAEHLGVEDAEGDDFHSPENRAKMAAQIPLTDDDRWPWLASLRDWAQARPEGCVMACSALRRSYRDVLRQAGSDVIFVHLATAPALLRERMSSREGHYMPVALLDSQLATLEPLESDEPGFVVDAALPLADEVTAALAGLRQYAASGGSLT